MTTIPRQRQTQDHELLILSRICDLLALLAPEARKRVVGYVLQRVDNLTTIAAANGPDRSPDDNDGDLLDRAGGATSEAVGG